MAIPTYDQFIEPLLRYLAQNPDGVSARLAHEEVANALQLSDEDRQQLLPSGSQLIYKNRAGWAHDRLKRAGLSSSPRRGFWKPTDDGIAFAKENSPPFSAALVERLAMGYIGVKLRPESGLALPPEIAKTPLTTAWAKHSLNCDRPPNPNCWNCLHRHRHHSSKPSFLICFTAWGTERAAPIFSELGVQGMAALMGSSR